MDAARARQSCTLILLALCAACGAGEAADRPGEDPAAVTAAPRNVVRVGAQVLLDDSLALVRGRRVGLITNHTGIVQGADGSIRSTVDLLHEHPDVELVALFGPEHGIRGTADPGERVESSVDAATGIPVHSLYGGTRSPTPEMLAGVEILLFDIQDVGARYYTYLWTMALAMDAAFQAGIPFVVLDRPNPVGGVAVQGNVLDPEFASFVGQYSVPMRHGLTPGEMARMVAGEFGVGDAASLTVVPMAGWARGMGFSETGLPWVAPSPNMPDEVSALHYPGSCLFEGTPLSVGRGTEAAFQQIGAPWLDAEALAAALNGYGLPDTRFEAVSFTPLDPGDGKFDGETVHGVRFRATGAGYDPTRAGVAALVEARRLAGDRWSWRESHFDRLAGTDRLRLGLDAGEGLETLVEGWDTQLRSFEALRRPYLLY